MMVFAIATYATATVATVNAIAVINAVSDYLAVVVYGRHSLVCTLQRKCTAFWSRSPLAHVQHSRFGSGAE